MARVVYRWVPGWIGTMVGWVLYLGLDHCTRATLTWLTVPATLAWLTVPALPWPGLTLTKYSRPGLTLPG